jgi:hypothetical protein
MIGLGAAAPAVLRGRCRIVAQSATRYSARAIRLVESSVVVDLLNQFVTVACLFSGFRSWSACGRWEWL